MSTDPRALRPSEKRALELWDSLPETERSYKAVAELYLKGDGEPITEGRAAGYVREALAKLGRDAEMPRRSNSTPATVSMTAPQTPAQMIEASIAKLTASITQAEQRATEAREQADSFDADEFRKSEEDRRAEAVKVAQAALKAWKTDADGEATNAAEAAEKALTDRADKVEAEVATATEALRASLAQYEATREMLKALETE